MTSQSSDLPWVDVVMPLSDCCQAAITPWHECYVYGPGDICSRCRKPIIYAFRLENSILGICQLHDGSWHYFTENTCRLQEHWDTFFQMGYVYVGQMTASDTLNARFKKDDVDRILPDQVKTCFAEWESKVGHSAFSPLRTWFTLPNGNP